ncbi:MAG: SIMPL domain-containing protein [Candidatus Peribacteraceae bacterium]|jgi:hypothetical protein
MSAIAKMKQFFTLPSVASAFTLGVCFIIATIIAANTAYSVKSLANAIAVTGSAQREVTSDVAKWRVSITTSTGLSDLKEGNGAVAEALGRLRAYLSNHEVAPEAITISPTNMFPLSNGYEKGNQTIGYQMNQEVLVESNDVEGLTQIAQNVGELLGEGRAVISSAGLEYYVSSLPDLRVEMMTDATADARQRAQNIARSSGGGLGKLVAASMGVFQVTPVNSVDYSDYGMYDTSTIKKKVTAIVRASFLIR